NLATDTESALVQYGTEIDNEMFGLTTSLNAPGKLYFYAFNNDLFGTTTLLPNTWYHGAITYDGATLNLYLNGVLEATKTTAPINTVPETNGLTIGYRPLQNIRWQGQLDEVEIFNRALSQAEIQAIYNAGGAGKCKPCVEPPSGMVAWLP